MSGNDDATRIDVGAYEAPCFIEEGCIGDCVTSSTFSPPPDGYVDGADLSYLLGQWGSCSGCCSDWVTSSTFAPPPDGVVDGADLSVLLGAWNRWCCDFEQGSPSPLMGGGESMMAGGSSEEESGSPVLPSGNPYDGTYLGLLLEELVATNDSDLVPIIAEMLQAMLEE